MIKILYKYKLCVQQAMIGSQQNILRAATQNTQPKQDINP